LNRFVGSLWNAAASDNTGILIVSDHGNAEDVSTSDHTTNKVPTLLLSRNKRNRELFAGKVKNLTDIYYTVIEYFADTGS
jgi:bisphosphoglycerate-independent phosphoglycerate mutase (AlkP superfamily)